MLKRPIWLLAAAAAAITALTVILAAPADAQTGQDVNLRKIIVKSEPMSSESALIGGADRIVYGWFDSADRELDTGQKVKSGKLVNFTQTFHVERSLKGQSSRLIRVLSTGIEPLPAAKDPLNSVYPGPLAEGTYVCFLKKLPRQNVYTIIGGWQGVYPVHDGKTIALEGKGFPQLGGLTLDQLAARIRP
jgi:hypothetical protein